MSPVPASPKIYHITHVDNLPSVIAENGLWSDAVMTRRGGPGATIGMEGIKQKRLTERAVKCYPGDYVGEYVPFNFCPRSVMLYMISCRNYCELTYRGGQEPIVHLEADLNEVITWAQTNGHRWAFSLTNAGAAYTEFRNRTHQLVEIDWGAVIATNFRNRLIKERKQAEFLVKEFFPWDMVRRIGVNNTVIFKKAALALNSAQHKPTVQMCRTWYFS